MYRSIDLSCEHIGSDVLRNHEIFIDSTAVESVKAHNLAIICFSSTHNHLSKSSRHHRIWEHNIL